MRRSRRTFLRASALALTALSSRVIGANGDIRVAVIGLGNSGIHALDVCRFLAGIEGLPPRALSLGGRFGYEDAGETPNTQLTLLDYRPAPVLVENRNLPMKRGMDAMDHHRGIREGVILQCEHGYFAGMRGGGGAFDNEGRRLRKFVGDGGAQHAANFIAAVRNRRAAELRAPSHGIPTRDRSRPSRAAPSGMGASMFPWLSPTSSQRSSSSAGTIHLSAPGTTMTPSPRPRPWR